ncbi:DUF2971 domain-containing protein [Candidatus Hepatincola sp. Av]
MELYRFRSCTDDNVCNLEDCPNKTKKTLLELRIDEIVNGGLYLASKEELNDPIDGMPNLYFESNNRQVWANFIEYIFWLYYQTHYNITWAENNINHLPYFLSNNQQKEYEKQKNIFINNQIIQTLICNLYKQKRLNHSELKNLLSYYLLYTIFLFLTESKHLWEEQNKLIYDNYLIIIGNPTNYYKQLDDIASSSTLKLTDIDTQFIHSTSPKKLMYEFIRGIKLQRAYHNQEKSSGFINSTLNHLLCLCFSKPYCACFSTQYNNSSLWGHYADSHKGLCIIYNTDENKKIDYYNTPFSNNQKYAWPITKVEYKEPKDLVCVNFFENLGSATPYYECFFYKDSDIKREQWPEEKHKKYWNNEHRYRHEKIKDWAWEEEYRLSFTYDSRIRYSSDNTAELQKIYINPNKHIKGVIFGYKMSYEAKQRIINEIKQAQSKNNLLDIQIYEAYFDDNNELEKRNITYLLKDLFKG